MDWIERADRRGRPFFAYLPTNTPNGPYHDVPEDLYWTYKDKDLSKVVLGDPNDNRLDKTARIFAMIENIDRNVGRLTERLEEMGLAEDTMVIFITDNRPNGRRYVGELRGRKTQVYKGGIRSPLWVRWPGGGLDPQTRIDEITAHIDIMPTILDAPASSRPRTSTSTAAASSRCSRGRAGTGPTAPSSSGATAATSRCATTTSPRSPTSGSCSTRAGSAGVSCPMAGRTSSSTTWRRTPASETTSRRSPPTAFGG